MTFTEWQVFSRSITERAERTRDMVRDRARKECAAAGLDPGLLGIHPHNAMVSYRAGAPWPGVDYSKVRKTLWLLERQFDATRLAERISSRAFKSVSR